MRFKEYSLILIHYNQGDRLEFAVREWQKQTIPPKEILILDDGSTDEHSITKLNQMALFKFVKVYAFPHCANLGYYFNVGINSITTEVYFTAEPSLLPVGLYFAQNQLQVLEPGKQFMPIYSTADSLENIDSWNMYEWTFGYNVMYSSNSKNNLYQKMRHSQKVTEDEIYPLEQWFPIEGCMRCKCDFLRYNESFNKWGFYDLDYAYRWRKKGQTFGLGNTGIVHWNHPKRDNFYEEREENAKLHRFFLNKFDLLDITYLEPELEEKLRSEYKNGHY